MIPKLIPNCQMFFRIGDKLLMCWIQGKKRIKDLGYHANWILKSLSPMQLDIGKAYDHVLKINGWIKFCIITVELLVLINRDSSGFFSTQRGLKQGIQYPFSFLWWLWKVYTKCLLMLTKLTA